MASLQLEAGAAADPDVLLQAARQARQFADVARAEALARAAFELGGRADAAVTLAELLYWQNRHDELLELLTAGVLDDAPPKQVMFGTMHIASALCYGKGQADEAEAWLARGIERLGRPYDIDLRAARARMLMVTGRSIASIDEAEAVLAEPDASMRARLNAYGGLLSSLAACGRLRALDEHAAAARELLSGVGYNVMTGSVAIGTFLGHWFAGRLPEHDAELSDLYDAAMSRAEDPFRGVWAFLVGRSALVQGRLADAIPALREGAAVMRLRDPGLMLPWCLAALAQALGAADDARGAEAALAEARATHFDVARNIEIEIGAGAGVGGRRCRQPLAGTGARPRRRRRSTRPTAATRWRRSGTTTRCASARPPATSPSRLEALTATVEGPVVVAMAAHARALASGDHVALGTQRPPSSKRPACCCTRRRRWPAPRSWRRTPGCGRRRATCACGRSSFAARCGPAMTPMLESISDRDALATLTRKEQEVALMAARGMTKREIADSLCVSVRTVGNHINHLYAKLGVMSRDELRVVLHIDAGGVGPCRQPVTENVPSIVTVTSLAPSTPVTSSHRKRPATSATLFSVRPTSQVLPNWPPEACWSVLHEIPPPPSWMRTPSTPLVPSEKLSDVAPPAVVPLPIS